MPGCESPATWRHPWNSRRAMPVTFTGLHGIGEIGAGADLAPMIWKAAAAVRELRDADVVVIAQKIVSKAEDRWVDLKSVSPSPRALSLAVETGKDPRLVEVILRESQEVLRAKPGVIVVVHRQGYVMAHAGVDQSNVGRTPDADCALLLPEHCDTSAERIRRQLAALSGKSVAVVISDSFGRAWRNGTVNIALGVAGLPALVDRRGEHDRDGRILRATEIGFADAIAAGAGLAMGEADEGTPVVLVGGLTWNAPPSTGKVLLRAKTEDMFR